MDEKTIAILGGGFGGLTVAHELRSKLGENHRIIVIDRKGEFMMGFSNLWILTGERKDPGIGIRPLSSLHEKGLEFVNEEIISIEPEKKIVRTETKEIYANYIIISLGADLAPDLVKGFRENAHDFYTLRGALSLRDALKGFRGGKVAVLVSSLPFKCPVAPYEAALLIDSLLKEESVRKKTEIDIYTPESSPVAVGGGEIGDKIKTMLSRRKIGYHPGLKIDHIKGEEKKLVFEGEEFSYDILAGIPPHKLPNVIHKTGMQDESGWVPVNPRTSETKYPGVYAIGDVTSIRVGGDKYLPKSAVFAEGEAIAVAGRIAADIKGEEASSRFSGYGFCFFETGSGSNAPVSGDFYAAAGPELKMDPPDARHHEKMIEFESSRLRKWFD